MKTTVKSASKEDIDKIIDIYSEWKKFRNVLPSEIANVDTYDDLIPYFDDSNNTRKYLIAKDEQKNPLGACYIDITFLKGNNIRLGNMMVKEEYRGKGVGAAIVDEVIKYAKENQVHKIWL
jgi:N-acetylglutamate synthase-like GNAT family acetyltransferase